MNFGHGPIEQVSLGNAIMDPRYGFVIRIRTRYYWLA
jgi:hypothetical protein